jgi:hypothetical protein
VKLPDRNIGPPTRKLSIRMLPFIASTQEVASRIVHVGPPT